MLAFLWFSPFVFAHQDKPEKPYVDDVKLFAKEFIGHLAAKNFSAAEKMFEDGLKQDLPAGKVKEIWETLLSQAGAFKNHGEMRTEQKEGRHIVYFTCKFEKALLDATVIFDSEKKITGFFFKPSQPVYEFKPPPYAKLDSFAEKDVVVGAGEWALPGTLTLPVGKGPFPAVVLVHGSGPHDRDETIGPNKPFRDLAWGLATKGIAVLRYEKRTKHYPQKLIPILDKLTFKEETEDDALEAVKLLRGMKEINPKRIFVLGHSQGGLMAPRIGLVDTGIAGLIVMAGPTRRMEDVIMDQFQYLASLKPSLTDADKAYLEIVEKQVARVKEPDLSLSTPAAELPLGMNASFWMDLKTYFPAVEAKKLKQPLLIIQGERDYQVNMEDFKGWQKELSGRKNVSFISYPGLNHLFMQGEGKSSPEEYFQPGHVDLRVVDDIAEWINMQRNK